VIAAVVCALAGLVVGTFLNVLIERIPTKDPADRVPVHLPPLCTWCGESRGRVGWIPIVGAVKPCPGCDERPRRRELVVELVTAALFVTMSIRFDDPVITIAYLFFCAFIVAVSAIDLEHYRIPDRLVFPALAIAVPGVVLVSYQQDIPEAIPRALLGAATIFGVLLIFHLISPRGMGFGDVKLSFSLGVALGWISWGSVYLGLFLGFLLGAIVGIVLIATRVKGRRDHVPFGPFLAAGTVIAILVGPVLLDLYRGT
jgi:leader peptidase (prepilin peptidase) / N-methyltransferase